MFNSCCCCCLVIVAMFLAASCTDAYFTMSDIILTVPTDRGKLPGIRSNSSLLHLFVQHESIADFPHVRIEHDSSSSSRNFFSLDPATGNVFFASNNIPLSLSNITTSFSTKNENKASSASLTVEFLALDRFDCDYIVEELCFWRRVRYTLRENTKPPVRLGSLSSPYFAGLCPGYRVKYAVIQGKSKSFQLVMASEGNSGEVLEAVGVFDREEASSVSVQVLCTVEDPQKTARNITKTLNVEILDVDDNAPQAQAPVINISLSPNTIQKGTVIGQELIFKDKDNSSVNNYKATILHDKLKILDAEPQCKQVVNDLNKTAPLSTVICCKLKFTETVDRTNWTYPIILQLNDTTLSTPFETKTTRLPINLHFQSSASSSSMMVKQEPLKKPLIYPSNRAKILRTAAPFARITQPDRNTNATNFTIQIAANKWKHTFNVTFVGGIVYVNVTTRLKTAPELIRVNISYVMNKKQVTDELEVHIVDEPTKTCEHMGANPNKWKACSAHKNRASCINATFCAISTGGASSVAKRQDPNRCMWRGEKTQSKEVQVSQLYGTCTPDTDTCPDGVCDPLEELHYRICPQDCTKDVLWPTAINHETNRGISKASGVCYCGDINCQCEPLPDLDPPPPETFPISSSPTTTTSSSASIIDSKNPNVSKHVDKTLMGIDLAHCGTTCVLGIVAGSVFLGGAFALAVICWRLGRVHKTNRGKFSDEAHQDLSAPLSDYINAGATTATDTLPLTFDMTTSLVDTAIISIINKYAPDPKWEFPRSQLAIEQTLGEGEFGRVLRAKAVNIAGQPGETTVAVKTLKEDARETELNDLLSEYQLLKEVSHPNVIRLLGVCTAPGGPIYLIIEFAEHGSLRNYLRRSRHLKSECGRLPTSSVLDETEVHYDEPNVSKITPKEILSFAWQICKGMAYLSEIKLVHRDLAARNVLLAADKVCKISDFGLTRDIYEDDAYFKRSKGRVPVKWMAPESLSDHIYTNKSDIWSFGILVWELVTLGATPYPGIAVQNIFHLLRQGYRMERPDNCSPALYDIMRSCWAIEPERRPTFQQLSAMWEKMLTDQVDYLDLENNVIHNRSYFCSQLPATNADDDDDDKLTSSNALNYLSKSQSYIKCGTIDKLQLPHQDDNADNPIIDNISHSNTHPQTGYETPVKVPRALQTPTNDFPQYYTDMAAGKTCQ